MLDASTFSGSAIGSRRRSSIQHRTGGPDEQKVGKRSVYAALGVSALALEALGAAKYTQGSTLRNFTDGRLEGADYWTDKPEILSAGMGFDDIIGLEAISKETVRDTGGSWTAGSNARTAKSPVTAF
jgi:hypothetical protein